MVAFGLRVLEEEKKAALMVALDVSLMFILTTPNYRTARSRIVYSLLLLT